MAGIWGRIKVEQFVVVTRSRQARDVLSLLRLVLISARGLRYAGTRSITAHL
jgi:hypothetical protein